MRMVIFLICKILMFAGQKIYRRYIKVSFNQIKKELHSISSKVLTERLNLLLLEGYLNRKEFLVGKMKRTLYSLTEKGKNTKEILMFIQKK
ncbi:MAG: winged helix-turn-helix transcriptional regulator [Nanoarchaeota archaeon]